MAQADENVAIKVEGVSKTFKLPHEKHTSLKSLFLSRVKRSKGFELQNALKDVSFEVKKGEFFGIVGRNGSGKSTLLKCLAGVYHPNKGSIKINGSLVPFIELGVGFNPELSGRDNIFLNGALLGFSRKKIESIYDEIVEFAELKEFMDQKLKNYSSGMQVRLAFSIAIRAQGDILLLDEVLAVGDSSFQQKCFDYFSTLRRSERTIVLVSHNMQAVEKYCDRALLLEYGIVKKIDSSSQIASDYENMFLRESIKKRKLKQKAQPKKLQENVSTIKVHDVHTEQGGKKSDEIEAHKVFQVLITIETSKSIARANIGINIKNQDRIMLVSTDTLVKLGTIELKSNKRACIKFVIENILTNGLYTINVGIADNGQSEADARVIHREDMAHQFIVKGVKEHEKSLAQPEVNATLHWEDH